MIAYRGFRSEVVIRCPWQPGRRLWSLPSSWWWGWESSSPCIYIGRASSLPTINYAASGGQVNVVLQEDPQNNSSSKPDWVSYFVQDPTTGQWIHTTLFSVPANTKVNMTIYGYDGCTPLRNNYFSQVQGTIGNTVTVAQFEQAQQALRVRADRLPGQLVVRLQCRAHVRDPGHGPVRTGRLAERQALGEQPLQLVAVHPESGGPYAKETFSFMSPGHAGTFRWQCLVPCGGGFLDGNGGPMQTLGYMMGDMDVVSS